MHFSLQRRVAAFVTGVAAMLALIGISAMSAWHHLGSIQSRLTRVQLESFRMADRLHHSILGLNRMVLRDRLLPHPDSWSVFLKASQEFRMFITQAKPQLRTQEEQDALEQLRLAFDGFVAAARDVETGEGPGVEVGRGPEPALGRLEGQTEHLLDLAYQLAEAHGQSVTLLLADSHRSLLYLRRLFLSALLVLLASGLGLARGLYRGLVAPLRLQLVEARAQAEQHEKLAALGVLAAGVAHEIRNPLTAIRARVFTLKKRLVTPGAERADVEVIDHEIDRLEQIVKEVLLFARPSESRRVRLPATLPLREVQGLLGPQLEARQILLQLEDSPEVEIAADPAQLKQVLINLVQNAADAIGERGCIRLRARLDRQAIAQRLTDVVVLEVEDNGRGIPAEAQKRLFDPFFSTKESGTGLGLSIAARLVDRQGGALRFQTEVGRGTTFGVAFPRVPADRSVPSATARRSEA